MDATYEVNVTPKVIVGAERQFSKPMSQIFGENASFEASVLDGMEGIAVCWNHRETIRRMAWTVSTPSRLPRLERVPLETP
jgi:hypothetical protein